MEGGGNLMKTINERFLEIIKKGPHKFKPGKEVPQLISESRKVLLNFYKFTKSLKVIELASLLISMNGWQNSKGRSSRKNFKTRDIVEVDLGLGHGSKCHIVILVLFCIIAKMDFVL